MLHACLKAGAALVLGRFAFAGPALAVSPLPSTPRLSSFWRKTKRTRSSGTICVPT